jgi:hypothetical protein
MSANVEAEFLVTRGPRDPTDDVVGFENRNTATLFCEQISGGQPCGTCPDYDDAVTILS